MLQYATCRYGQPDLLLIVGVRLLASFNHRCEFTQFHHPALAISTYLNGPTAGNSLNLSQPNPVLDQQTHPVLGTPQVWISYEDGPAIYYLQQGECVGTVITSVQTYNMTECLENCALVTGCTWVTVYYDVPYCKIFSTCDGGVNPVTCPNCLSSELSNTLTDQVMICSMCSMPFLFQVRQHVEETRLTYHSPLSCWM